MPSAAAAGVLKKPIDPKQQTALAFGDRSHWLQPWRGYLDTPPATRLRDAIGINFNVEVEEAPATAKLLARSGFKRARVEFGWDQMDYGDPTRLHNPGRLHQYLEPLKANGIRPLILLNANHGIPGPARFFDANLLQPAASGARRVLLDQASAHAVVPGKTGLNDLQGRRAADVIFTSVDAAGWATLSRPLPRDLPAGPHPAATLRFAPFGPPRLEDGRVNPLFRETLMGWLYYVRAVTREARAALGSDAFDVEIWNELSFGSDFLYQETYYDPPRESGQGDVTDAIRDATVRYLRSAASGVSGIGIGDGFASQRPWGSGANSPAGLTAIDKHPYYNMKHFPADSVFNGISPIDARGATSSSESGNPGNLIRRDRFVPRYDAFFPEYILSAIQTEHLVRDLSPITTPLYDTPHGRRVRPRGGSAPAVWITEANLDPTGADPPGDHLSDVDVQHMHAKAALRYYTAFSNKGVSAIDLFGARGGNLQLVDQRFYDAVRGSHGAYPGDQLGGVTTSAVGRLARSLGGAQQLRRTRPLSLLRISDRHNHRQFDGDGTAAHPPLYNRDVLGFFPFQLRPGEYVAAVYVMTRNMAKPYRGGSDPGRYDLPPERYNLTIGGLRSSRVSASATDPMTGQTVPVKARRLGRGRVRVSMPVTDSPRMLRLVEGGTRTSVSLRAKRKRVSRRGRQVFLGRVRSNRPACASRLVLTLKRWGARRHRWSRIRTVSASSAQAGRFRASVRHLRRGRYRAHATAVAKGCGRASSRNVAFRVR